MNPRYYSLKKEEVFKELNSSDKGLTDSEVESRLKKYGKNVLKEEDARNVLEIFLSQFKSPLILILLFATIISMILGEMVDAFIIIGIIILSSFLGFYQEFKSDQALKSLKKYISFKARVLRNGEKEEVNAKELVPGDIVFLNIGDIVLADLKILESEELYADESVITGESYPVKKFSSEIKEKNLPLTKQSNMLFMGSEISGGTCRAIVVLIGENTEFGKTASILSAKEPPSDFQKGINNFGNFLIKIIFLLTILVFAINFFLGKGLFNSFLFAIALAVGVTPELLPVIMTISMSRGAIKMAEKKVVVKKLISIEDLGNMDILCADKTGTLTENKVSLTDYFDINGKKAEQIVQYSLICNSAISHNHKVSGNTLDRAIIEYADSKRIKAPRYERIEDIELDYQRKRMSSIVKIGNKKYIICKGSTTSMLEVCSKIKSGSRIESIKGHNKGYMEKYEELSKKGLRVVSIAYSEIKTKKEYKESDERDLIFLGSLVSFDPPKKDVKTTLNKLGLLGVEMKILTGDNELVTREVCRQVGFEIKGKIICGEELKKMDEKEFKQAVKENNVFARIIPEQKLKICS